ncbi:MAG: hypothetical protein ACRENX_07705 [Candidatus Dormibacteria bacterium]
MTADFTAGLRDRRLAMMSRLALQLARPGFGPTPLAEVLRVGSLVMLELATLNLTVMLLLIGLDPRQVGILDLVGLGCLLTML